MTTLNDVAIYVLTDGSIIYDSSLMAADEAVEANRLADVATDGNIWWARERA